ncbi:hypothetical protein ACFE04_024244 [Oxalis oulophora]
MIYDITVTVRRLICWYAVGYAVRYAVDVLTQFDATRVVYGSLLFLGGLAIFPLVAGFFLPRYVRVLLLKCYCTAAGVATLIGTVGSLVSVFRYSRVDSIRYYSSGSLLLCSILWMVYGSLSVSIYVLVPTVVGIILSGIMLGTRIFC